MWVLRGLGSRVLGSRIPGSMGCGFNVLHSTIYTFHSSLLRTTFRSLPLLETSNPFVYCSTALGGRLPRTRSREMGRRVATASQHSRGKHRESQFTKYALRGGEARIHRVLDCRGEIVVGVGEVNPADALVDCGN